MPAQRGGLGSPEVPTELGAPRFRGVYPVLATPFAEDGALDLLGLRRVVDLQLASGVAGVVCFGLASEVYKLDDRERHLILETVVDQVEGRVEVIAGAEHTGTEVAAARCVAARDAGATATMLFPPSLVKPDRAGIIRYYRAAAEAGLPIIVQDAPAWTGVPLPVDLLQEISRVAPGPFAVKVEAPPTAPKMGALIEEHVECIGGYGTLYLLEELERGALATMPGCAFPQAQVRMLDLFQGKREAEATQLFDELLPLTVFAMSSLDIFVATQKHLLQQAGIITSDRLREPAVLPDAHQRSRIASLIGQASLRRFMP